MKKIYLLLTIILIFISSTVIHAEEERTEPLQKPAQEQINDPVSSSPPTGFSKGNHYIRAWIGVSLAGPGGSFIRHEKLYDETLNYEILRGEIKNIEPFNLFPPLTKTPQYESGGFFGLSFEYALMDHFGMGTSISGTNVWSKRPKTLQDPRDGKYYLNPWDSSEELQLSVSAVTFDLSYHILKLNKFDPFLSVHAGPAFAAGTGHGGYKVDIYRQDEEIHNGRGFAYGSSLGMNIYFNNGSGIRPEVTYMRYDFHADEFSSRSYYNTYFNIGLFVVGI